MFGKENRQILYLFIDYIYHQPHHLLHESLNTKPFENGDHCHFDHFPLEPPSPPPHYEPVVVAPSQAQPLPAPPPKLEPEHKANNSSKTSLLAASTNQSDDEKRVEAKPISDEDSSGTPVKQKLNKLEMEYQAKEKQQLMEIELLRKKLEQTERAMANIIARMDTIPGQKKVRFFY